MAAKASKRRAWVWFGAGAVAIVAGFWPTFYGDPRSNDLWHTAHGIAWTSWLALLITQSVLIGANRRRLHQRLGWASVVLFGFLVGTTWTMIGVELRGPQPFPRRLRLELTFLDLVLLALFVGFYVAGIVWRRRPALHARLMGGTILVGLIPAVGRLYAEHIPFMHGLQGALPWTFFTLYVVLAVVVLLEWRRGRVLWPMPVMLAVLAFGHLGTVWAGGEQFASLARAAGAPV